MSDSRHPAIPLPAAHQPMGQPLGLPGMGRAHLHEIHAHGDDWAAAMAFAMASVETGNDQPILLLRCPKHASMPLMICAEGLVEQGIDPARLVLVDTPDRLALLRAGLDAARVPGLAAVLIETWGPLPEYTLTASRQFVLAAEASGARVILLRGNAEPRASAAHSRWQIASAASRPWAAAAPGAPALAAHVLRHRGGPAGQDWRLEWDNKHGYQPETPFETDTGTHNLADKPAPAGGRSLSGAVVPLSALRKGAARKGHGALPSRVA